MVIECPGVNMYPTTLAIQKHHAGWEYRGECPACGIEVRLDTRTGRVLPHGFIRTER
jgi:hypothetical protein